MVEEFINKEEIFEIVLKNNQDRGNKCICGNDLKENFIYLCKKVNFPDHQLKVPCLYMKRIKGEIFFSYLENIPYRRFSEYIPVCELDCPEFKNIPTYKKSIFKN